MGKNPGSLLRFGVFEADLATAELRKGGRPVKLQLQPQPFRVLALLLERAGELVTRGEIHRTLWGKDTFVDFETGLNYAIKKIREALGDDADRPRYIETLPRRGYRFIAKLERSPALPLRQIPETSSLTIAGTRHSRVISIAEASLAAHEGVQVQSGPSGTLAEAADRPIDDPGALRLREASVELAVPAPWAHAGVPWRFILIAAAGALAAAAAILWTSLVPETPPKVLRSAQLTHTGRVQPHSRVLTDGNRVYFTERIGGTSRVAQIPLGGGEPTVVSVTPSLSFALTDLDPGGTRFLVTTPSTHFEDPVWVAPVTGGSAWRLADTIATDTAWSPDGGRIAYGREDGGIYTVSEDGGQPHKLLQAPGFPLSLRWSPDGKMIGFTLRDRYGGATALWEMASDGANPHRLLEGWKTETGANVQDLSCGLWSPDHKYLVFRSGFSSLWAVRERRRWLGRGLGAPVQLYTSPDQIGPPSFSRDGKRIYFVNFQPRRELVRYEASHKQFLPYLGGIPAVWLSFSRDGRWVAYRQDTDGTLWRSRTDGSERLRLTLPPMEAYHPSWSPAGDRIAFSGGLPGNPSMVYTISIAGGPPELANPDDPTGSEPTWSPDGRSLLLRRWNSSSLAHGSEGDLYLLDLRDRKVHMLPGSNGFPDGFKGAQWSPDGHYVAALERNSRLMLFDFTTERWSQLASGTDINAVGMRWSGDSRSVYYQDLQQSQDQPIFRVRVSDGLVEGIASSHQVLSADLLSYRMTGLAPDGSPLASLLHSSSDIYALEVSLP